MVTYHGWLMAYDHASLAQKGVWVTTPNGSLGAIWESGIWARGRFVAEHIFRGREWHI